MLPFDPETPQWSMTRVHTTVPPSWGGAKVQLQVIDATPTGAVFFDDIWLHTGEPATP